ncbi:hypothetical protein Back2_13640 [Nocardioides baekrokdamisoli]|uniref:DUF2029 domain-containing protein n=1 Tax=Nocardioides baekrokdamisoli TaxID=1804624 RepID=A0A3G9IDP4_9ACTN|nr:hypothetical protein [Nocardioides baekrokdamisoli]BBH17077.1 hypothetical protein Back2_13640 [Nocardioides baekrokdamisoli]
MRALGADRLRWRPESWLWLAAAAIGLSSTAMEADVAIAGQLVAVALLGAVMLRSARSAASGSGSESAGTRDGGLLLWAAVAVAFVCEDVVRLGSWTDVSSSTRSGLELAITLGAAAALGCGLLKRPWLSMAFAALAVAAATVTLLHAPIVMDVGVFLRGSADALLHGHDPYSLTFTSPYPAAGNRLFYSPQVVSGTTLDFGFPYPPPALISAVVGFVLGDVRLGGLIALVIAAVVLIRYVGLRGGLILLLPGTLFVLSNFWVEPVSILLLVLTVVGASRGSRWTPVWLGLLLVSKQYFVVAAPLLILLLPTARAYAGGLRRFSSLTVATAVLALAPFLAWDPAGFWRSVVRLQFLQPFRADSSSALVWSVNHWGWPPSSTYGWLPLVGGFITALIVAWRAPRTPAAFALGVGFSLLVLITLGKQAFANYFFLVEAAVVVAALTWDPPRRPAHSG